MNFRDLLYFSKGERRILALLLCLITIAWIILMLSENDSPDTSITQVNDTQVIIGPNTKKESVDSFLFHNSPQEENTKKKNDILTIKTFKQPKERVNNKPKTDKYAIGTKVELNSADTTILKKVPGIGSVFSNRIVKYRDLLGGFHSVSQLSEVYGIDSERYETLQNWFVIDDSFITPLNVNYIPVDSLVKHPYINYRQAYAIERFRR
jgi:DNA uptake protein ComE-like DNA-binding protein